MGGHFETEPGPSGSSLGDLNWEGQRGTSSRQKLKLKGYTDEVRREGCVHDKSWPSSHEKADAVSRQSQ